MSFINRILVPTDFSPAADNALRYACSLGELTQAEIKVLHVFNVPVVDPYMPGDTMEAMMQEIKKAAEENMERVLGSVNYPKISGECLLGFVTDDVAQYANDQSADLIVMGTTGASGVKEVLFGSNASGVMAKAHIKVLSVPAEFTNHAKPSKIVYASDFTGNEEMRCLVFADLAKAWGAELEVLHVKSDEPVFSSEPASVLIEKIKARIGHAEIRFEEISSNDVTAAIETYVQTTGASLLGMAMHKRNLFERLFSKSKTKEIAHHARIPLITLQKD